MVRVSGVHADSMDRQAELARSDLAQGGLGPLADVCGGAQEAHTAALKHQRDLALEPSLPVTGKAAAVEDQRQAAAAAVMVEAIEPEDTDTGEQAESGDPDTSESSGDSGDGEPSLTDDDVSIEHGEPKEGCSCAVGGTAAPALLGWVLLALRRRQS